jgi:Acyl-CoA synthetases (AMP-forming)/AMP-acid ligases II
VITTNMSFYQYWRDINQANSSLKALEYFGKSWTFTEVKQMIIKYAKAISKLKIENGKSITICAPLIPASTVLIYAANMLGIQINLISEELLKYNPKKYLEETDTDTLIILDVFLHKVTPQAVYATNIKNIILISFADDSLSPEAIIEKLKLPNLFGAFTMAGVPEHINLMNKEQFYNFGEDVLDDPISVFVPESTAVVLYTGGSTGIPKGVELYNEKINRVAQLCTEVNLDYIPGDRNLLLIPPNHPTSLVHGLIAPWACHEGGITQVCQPIYNRFTFAKDIVENNIQSVVAAPSHYATLPTSGLNPGDLVNFKNPFCGGEPIPYELALAINKALSHASCKTELIYAYGMSELGPTAMVSPHVKGLGNKVGKPVPGVEVRIVDDEGNILGANQRGNLQIKAECAMKGYFKNAELTKSFYTKDGFGKTGDIAIKDDNGYYSVPGRAGDSYVIKSNDKTERIYLFDIENYVYKAAPEVILEAEAVGLSIENKSEKIPVVHIVLNEEYKNREEEALILLTEKCNAELNCHEIPKGFKFRDKFATNSASGKRDFKSLTKERDDYLRYNDGKVEKISFIKNGSIVCETVYMEDYCKNGKEI